MLRDVPFDLQPLRVILYDKDDPAWGVKLRSSLISSLIETIPDPTSAVPAMFRKVVKSQAPEESETVSRLSTLERQISSLEMNRGFIGTRQTEDFGLSEFQEGIRLVSSRDHAAEITKDALMRGRVYSKSKRKRRSSVELRLLKTNFFRRNAMCTEVPSLAQALSLLPNFRQAKGKRYDLLPILLLCCIAMMCGCTSQSAIADWGRNYSHHWLWRLGFKRSSAPSQSTLHRLFKGIDVLKLESLLSD